MVAGAVFHGMREAPLTFAPTYKFDKGVPGPHAYDSSEKLRVPAWTDRVFFKGAAPCSTHSMRSTQRSAWLTDREGVYDYLPGWT